MFTPRKSGTTLRRVQEAIRAPHDSRERFDPQFPVSFRCDLCGCLGYGPREQLQEALREHKETCSARRVKADQPSVIQILYPKQ